jgi:hypothetical protein
MKPIKTLKQIFKIPQLRRAYTLLFTSIVILIILHIIQTAFAMIPMDPTRISHAELSTTGSIAFDTARYLWIAFDSIIITTSLLISYRYAYPERQLLSLVHRIADTMSSNADLTPIRAQAASLPQALATLAISAQEQMHLRVNLQHELEKYRTMLAMLHARSDTILRAATAEMTKQYQSIISYAHYLDEQIHHGNASMDMRYDYDDVCESGFNLKLIAGALNHLRPDAALAPQPIILAELMQSTLLALSSSLDRRAMQLTTIEVDEAVTVTSDATLLSHVIWMMLLGIIRYTADESTLRMRCFYDQDHRHAIISIIASELTPGTMTPQERVEHAAGALRNSTPNLFVEAVRVHANVTLAALLLQKISASIETMPLSPYACEIRLTIPL